MSKSLDQKEQRDRLRLVRSSNVGPITFKSLLQKFGSASKAIDGLPQLLGRMGQRKISLCSAMQAEDEIAKLHAMNGTMLYWGTDEYPKLLAQIADPPPVISIIGHKILLEKPMLAIVGARNASSNGNRLATRFGEVMAQHNYAIVSGMARGIDTAAHEGALEQGTIAVLAGGVDNIYPPQNARLYHEICEAGVLLSEAPFGTKPSARHFPRRNRIISGLSLGVLVIEAARKSGSLITANMAVEQNREVFAVPGSPLDGRLRGTNFLIKQGAILCETPDDILPVLHAATHSQMLDDSTHLDLFAWEKTDNGQNEEMRQDRINQVLATISATPIQLEQIIAASGMGAMQAQAALMELELCQKIECLPQAYYVIHGAQAIDELFGQ